MNQLIVNGICKGSAFGLIAAGFGLIYSTTRVFHIAHAAVCVAAAYTTFALVNWLNCGVVVACLAGIIVAGLIGIGIERIVYRPLTDKNASGTVLLLSSLAAYMVLTNTISLLFGEKPRLMLPWTVSTLHSGNLVLTYPQIAQFAVFVIVSGLFWMLISRTRFGLITSASSQDPIMVEILGIDTGRVRVAALAIGSALAGLGYTLNVLDGGIDPHSGMDSMLIGAVSCMIVGPRRLVAPLVAGLTLGLAQSLLIGWIPASWVSSFTYVLLIALLMFKPRGLLTATERMEEK